MDQIIPQDMWLLIVSFLDDKTKRLMRLVNTKLFNIIKYNNFNLYFTRKEDVPAITDRLSKYSWPIKLTFSKSKIDDSGWLEVFGHLPKLTNLIELITADPVFIKTENITLDKWMQLSVLTNIQVWGVNWDTPFELCTKFTNLTMWSSNEPEETLAPVLKQNPNLKKLYSHGGLKTWPFALVPNPEKISTLRVSTQGTIVHGVDTWSSLANLTRFEFFGEKDQPNEINLENLTSLAYLILGRCATLPSLASNIKLENVRLFDCPTLPFLATNTNLTKLDLDCEHWSLKNTEALSRLAKLKELQLAIPTEMEGHGGGFGGGRGRGRGRGDNRGGNRGGRGGHHGGGGGGRLQFQILSHLTQLSTLIVINDRCATLDDINEDLYRHIPPQIRALELRITTDAVDISRLTHLTNLESLSSFDEITSVEYFSNLFNITQLVLGHFSNEDFIRSIQKLTKLQDLRLDQVYDDNENQPDLSCLVHLTRLNFGYCGQTQLKYLTKLENLTFVGALENCACLTELINLTSLDLRGAILKVEDSLWQNLAKLTKIQDLWLPEVDRDDRLLLLTTLTNITSIFIHKRSKEFTGAHFTALTSLQLIEFRCADATVAHKREDIKRSMPYLLKYYHHN